ncbi:MAG TPA: TonB C-terminal domain-containing protein [Gemmatimonadales bacterium]|nr:TonB C-terminal domain-containing protein [Gemmatimonadales bacterium]
MRRGIRPGGNTGLALAGTLVVHGIAGFFVFAAAATRHALPPTYTVRLVAAPALDQETRPAPQAFDRPAEERPAPVPAAKPPPKSTVSRAAPPPTQDATRREAAPRTTPTTQPLPGERPSTGSDVATVSTEGIAFPFPEYLQNIVSQVLRRWQRPTEATPLEAEVSFLVHRDGSVTDLSFAKHSGSFAFDLEAQGAIEEAGRFKAFGALPDGWAADVLFVRFYFSGRRQ